MTEKGVDEGLSDLVKQPKEAALDALIMHSKLEKSSENTTTTLTSLRRLNCHNRVPWRARAKEFNLAQRLHIAPQ